MKRRIPIMKFEIRRVQNGVVLLPAHEFASLSRP